MSSCSTIVLSRRLLASAIAAAFVAAAPLAAATTWTVDDTCGDAIDAGDATAHTGTLRFCVDQAGEGDSVDLSQTTCSTISLTTGAIEIKQQSLTLNGGGRNQTVVSGKDGLSLQVDRVFYASNATGDVTFADMSVTYGLLSGSTGPVNGGCIYGKGSITLDDVGVYHCSATALSGATAAYGGGVYAPNLTIRNHSHIADNLVSAVQLAVPAEGGGAATKGNLYLYDSVIALNTAAAPDTGVAFGGGILARGKTVISRALITGNHSSTDGGGIDLFAINAASTAVITNSTISTNGASRRTGGVLTNFTSTTIANSTIAFNSAVNFTGGPTMQLYYSPGVSVTYRANPGPPTLTLQSSILAGNHALGYENDLSKGAVAAKVTIQGNDNLIAAFGSDMTLSSDQGNILGHCPLLGPLRDNGGGSLTHALHSASLGVGSGNNSIPDPTTQAAAIYDQRGPGYTRTENSAVDIGAYQRQHDNLFDAAFDGCR